MKDKLLFVALACWALLGTMHSSAQSWQDVGMPKFTAGEADYESIVMGKNDTPYVAYMDYANNMSVTVMKFNGAGWVPVGSPGFTGNTAQYTSLVMDSSGRPYVIYQDGADTARATVSVYNAASAAWEILGTQGLSIGQADFTCIAMGSSDTPFVMFSDLADSCVPRFSVMKFNGSNWEYVGGARFTPILTNPGAIAVWGNTPYIAYSDTGGLGKVIVRTWDGSNWVTLGNPDFSAGGAASISLVIHNGIPYVAYSDYANSMKATVMKFNGTTWEAVGSAGFSAGEADNTALAIDNAGVPYVVYADASTGDSYATVMKFNGTGWVNVGGAGFTGTLAEFSSIAVNSTGMPYVFYQGFAGGQKGTVERFVANTSVKNIAGAEATLTIFPDPNNGSFTLNVSAARQEEARVVITNMLGAQVSAFVVGTNTNTPVQMNVSPGVYSVSVYTSAGIATKQVVVE